MIDIQDILIYQQRLIEEFGGSHGIRSMEMLESAIARPWQTFGGVDLYPSIEAKSAAVIESIVINHPFIDGNKRIGYVLMRLLLMSEGLDIHATEDQKYELVIGIASGDFHFDDILDWIKAFTN